MKVEMATVLPFVAYTSVIESMIYEVGETFLRINQKIFGMKST